MAARPSLEANWRAGVEDALDLLREALAGQGGGVLDEALADLARALKPVVTSPGAVLAQLGILESQAKRITTLVHGLAKADPKDAGTQAEAVIWAEALKATILCHQRILLKQNSAVEIADLSNRLLALVAGFRRLFDEMSFGFLIESGSRASVDRLSCRRR